MPSKNVVRTYIPGFYYHLYTRGVNKRKIFKDEQDYLTFIRYLKLYLLPIEILKKITSLDLRINKFIKNNVSDEIELVSFALMPNHIHLLIKLRTQKGVEKFMHRILIAYVMYFNQKYKRVGTLFQSRYKAVPVLNDDYLIYLTRYIHKNPLKIKPNNPFEFTSMPYFIGERKANWIKPNEILDHFSETNPLLSYKAFVENPSNSIDIAEITLEE